MSVIIVREDDFTIPVREDGEPFYAALLLPGEPTIFADTLTEIVGEVITDYPNEAAPLAADTDEALIARLETLEVSAGLAQAVVAADLAENHGRKFTEDELTAMLSDKASAALELTEPWEDSDAPLLLITTNYAPYTPFARPEGSKIVWLDPTTELTFLRSLAAMHGGELMIKDA